MADNYAEILTYILHKKSVNDLSDLADSPEKFPKICGEIFDRMIEALTSEVERKLPVSILETVEEDLMKITRSLIALSQTDLVYPLSQLWPFINEARSQVGQAAEIYTEKSKVGKRIQHIQKCVEQLIKARDWADGLEISS